MAAMEERRKTKRYDVAYPVEHKDGPENRVLEVVDLSKGGLAFTDRTELRKDQEIDVHLFLKKKRFDVRGLVVHAQKLKDDLYKFGVKFMEAPDDFITTLEKELEQITHQHRESNLYRHKDLTFRHASEEFLKRKHEEHGS